MKPIKLKLLEFQKIISVLLSTLMLPNVVIAQHLVTDTLRYYQEDENSIYWIDDCDVDGFCEPVAVKFSQGSLPVSAVSVEKVRFKIAVPGIFRMILYSRGDVPTLSNIVWEDSVLVDDDEIDDSDTMSVSPWKEILFNEVAQPLRFPIWFQVNTKAYNVGFNFGMNPGEWPQTYTGQLVDGSIAWIPAWDLEFISELVVSYSPTYIADPSLEPSSFVLHHSYPNPFNPMTTIRYSLPEELVVSLDIYDVKGQLVQNLQAGPQAAGSHDVIWTGDSQSGIQLAAGMYFVRLQAGQFSSVIKTVYAR